MKAIVKVFQTRRSRKYVKKRKEKKNGLKAPTQKNIFQTTVSSINAVF